MSSATAISDRLSKLRSRREGLEDQLRARTERYAVAERDSLLARRASIRKRSGTMRETAENATREAAELKGRYGLAMATRDLLSQQATNYEFASGKIETTIAEHRLRFPHLYMESAKNADN